MLCYGLKLSKLVQLAQLPFLTENEEPADEAVQAQESDRQGTRSGQERPVLWRSREVRVDLFAFGRPVGGEVDAVDQHEHPDHQDRDGGLRLGHRLGAAPPW